MHSQFQRILQFISTYPVLGRIQIKLGTAQPTKQHQRLTQLPETQHSNEQFYKQLTSTIPKLAVCPLISPHQRHTCYTCLFESPKQCRRRFHLTHCNYCMQKNNHDTWKTTFRKTVLCVTITTVGGRYIVSEIIAINDIIAFLSSLSDYSYHLL